MNRFLFDEMLDTENRSKKTASNTITVISEVSLSLSHSLVQFLFLPFYLNSTICNTWSSIAQLMRQTSSNYCRSLFHIVKTECYLIKVNAENAVKKSVNSLNQARNEMSSDLKSFAMLWHMKDSNAKWRNGNKCNWKTMSRQHRFISQAKGIYY